MKSQQKRIKNNEPYTNILVEVTNSTSHFAKWPVGTVFDWLFFTMTQWILVQELSSVIVSCKPAVPMSTGEAKLFTSNLNIH